MINPRQFYNDQIRKKIDQLLDSSVDLDQITIIESEMLPLSEKVSATCSALLQKMQSHAMENAKKIQEARELILAIR